MRLISGVLRLTTTPVHSDDTDEALMATFCAGNDRAFDTLFERHGQGIYRLTFRLTRNRATAEDLTQATFASMVRARHRFVPGSQFKKWLYVIAMNAWREYGRKHKHERIGSDDLPEPSYEAHFSDPRLERAVREALATLPDGQREAVLLHHFEEFSFKEVAEMLGVSEGAVKVRAHRGYEQLRTLLKETHHG